jgi:hypothetical protein
MKIFNPPSNNWKSAPDGAVGRPEQRIAETMITRIKLHLICPCRNWHQARFHLVGIEREFVPLKLQQFVR